MEDNCILRVVCVCSIFANLLLALSSTCMLKVYLGVQGSRHGLMSGQSMDKRQMNIQASDEEEPKGVCPYVLCPLFSRRFGEFVEIRGEILVERRKGEPLLIEVVECNGKLLSKRSQIELNESSVNGHETIRYHIGETMTLVGYEHIESVGIPPDFPGRNDIQAPDYHIKQTFVICEIKQ